MSEPAQAGFDLSISVLTAWLMITVVINYIYHAATKASKQTYFTSWHLSYLLLNVIFMYFFLLFKQVSSFHGYIKRESDKSLN